MYPACYSSGFREDRFSRPLIVYCGANFIGTTGREPGASNKMSDPYEAARKLSDIG